MNQKFSQLNKDYARSMAWRDDVLLKRSARRGVGSFFLGLLMILLLLAAFFSVKKPLLKQVQQKINSISTLPEKNKYSMKHVKAQNRVHLKQQQQQEYGFYTILPNMEVKSAHHDE